MFRLPRCPGLGAAPAHWFAWAFLVCCCAMMQPAAQRACGSHVSCRRDATPGQPAGRRWTKYPLLAVDDPLWAKGIVLEDGGQRYVLWRARLL